MIDNNELRKAVLEFLNPAPKAQEVILPIGTATNGRTPEQLQKVSDDYLNWLMSTDHQKWTPEQREDVRRATARAAKAWQEGREL